MIPYSLSEWMFETFPVVSMYPGSWLVSTLNMMSWSTCVDVGYCLVSGFFAPRPESCCVCRHQNCWYMYIYLRWLGMRWWEDLLKPDCTRMQRIQWNCYSAVWCTPSSLYSGLASAYKNKQVCPQLQEQSSTSDRYFITVMEDKKIKFRYFISVMEEKNVCFGGGTCSKEKSCTMYVCACRSTITCVRNLMCLRLNQDGWPQQYCPWNKGVGVMGTAPLRYFYVWGMLGMKI